MHSGGKNKDERVAGIARTSMHHWLGTVYQYLQKKLDVTDSSIEELGSAKTNILMWGLFMSSSTKAAVHLGQKDVESNSMFMNVYVEEIKYLFSIVQREEATVMLRQRGYCGYET